MVLSETMQPMHDLVIRNANLVDGTGAPTRHGVSIGIDGAARPHYIWPPLHRIIVSCESMQPPHDIAVIGCSRAIGGVLDRGIDQGTTYL